MSNFRRYIPFFTDFSAYLWAFPKFTIYLFRIKCYNFLTFCHIYIMCFTNKTAGTFILYVVFSYLGSFFFLYIFHNFYLFFLFYKKKICAQYTNCAQTFYVESLFNINAVLFLLHVFGLIHTCFYRIHYSTTESFFFQYFYGFNCSSCR